VRKISREYARHIDSRREQDRQKGRGEAENSSASATISASFSRIKYTATSIQPSLFSSVVFHRPQRQVQSHGHGRRVHRQRHHQPADLSQQEFPPSTGFASKAYSVRLSISLDTSPTPINTAMNTR